MAHPEVGSLITSHSHDFLLGFQNEFITPSLFLLKEFLFRTINTNSSGVIPPRESPSKKHSPEKNKNSFWKGSILTYGTLRLPCLLSTYVLPGMILQVPPPLTMRQSWWYCRQALEVWATLQEREKAKVGTSAEAWQMKLCHMTYMAVSENGGKTPKMDGENNGKPYLKWMIWGYHYFWKHPYMSSTYSRWWQLKYLFDVQTPKIGVE